MCEFIECIYKKSIYNVYIKSLSEYTHCHELFTLGMFRNSLKGHFPEEL